MAATTSIEWTDRTWNPVTGCTKVSPACAHCYIERTPPFRTKGRRFVKGHIPLQFHEDRLTKPLSWRHPRRVFVNSLSDLFHPDVPDAFIDKVFAVMALASQHTFQVLTKRPERMRVYFSHHADVMFHRWADAAEELAISADKPRPFGQASLEHEWWNTVRNDKRWPLPNVWLGTSVENQPIVDKRIPELLQTPAAVRFISAEPLLGPVDLCRFGLTPQPECTCYEYHCGHEQGCPMYGLSPESIRQWEQQHAGNLDWVIVGGESGPRVRPMRIGWVRSIRDQCLAAGVAFFFKQWGGKTPKSGGRELDGRTWDEMPA